MSMIVLLDSGPLGAITNPRGSPETFVGKRWFDLLISKGVEVRIPEIADYEVRRELLRADKKKGIKRLDELRNYLSYIPITTPTMLLAAQLWAQVRKQGMPTADDRALDGDVILAAQASIVASEGYNVVIATTNVRHLSRFTQAKLWREIE